MKTMTDEYIKRSDALKAARYYKNRREENHVPSVDDIHLTEYQLLAQAINSIPAADVEPVRHAEWVFDPLAGDWICSDCDLHSMEHGRFCPNCGAKMDKEADDA